MRPPSFYGQGDHFRRVLQEQVSPLHFLDLYSSPDNFSLKQNYPIYKMGETHLSTLPNDSAKRLPRRLYERAVGVLCDSQFTMERTIDIGEEGMLVRSSRHLKEGQNVLLNFWMDKVGYVIVPAQIRWVKNDDNSTDQFFGLFFLKVSFDYRRALRTFIAAKPKAELDLEKKRMLIFPELTPASKAG